MSEHLVQFYESSAALTDSAAQFLSAGLAAGDSVVVIATPPHREDLDRRLFADGLLTRNDRYVALDAVRTMEQFMVGDVPDAGRFSHVIGNAIQGALGGSGHVRAFGEMVALLAIDGRWPAALHLEELWNGFIAEHPLSLLCAYPDAVFRDEGTRVPFETICAQHSSLIPADARHPRFPVVRHHAHPRSRLSFVSLVERAIAMVRPLADERHHVLTVTWPEQDLHVEGDRARLERVFVNLLANAVAYTPSHGRIRVSAAHEEREAVLRVRDSGAGLVPGVLSNALDPDRPSPTCATSWRCTAAWSRCGAAGCVWVSSSWSGCRSRAPRRRTGRAESSMASGRAFALWSAGRMPASPTTSRSSAASGPTSTRIVFERLADYFTDDAVYDDVPIPAARVVGPAAIVRKLRIGFERVAQHVHHEHRIVADETTVVTEHTEDWHFAADHVVALPFVSVQVIAGGRIALWRDYSNIDTLLSAAPAWWIEHVTASWAAQ
jgi:limonene-1,2-epoxide hydrolase